MIMGDGKRLIPEVTSILITMTMSLGILGDKSSTRRWMDVSVFSCADDSLDQIVRDANLTETGVF